MSIKALRLWGAWGAWGAWEKLLYQKNHRQKYCHILGKFSANSRGFSANWLDVSQKKCSVKRNRKSFFATFSLHGQKKDYSLLTVTLWIYCGAGGET
ncbi:hypothetical protein [Desulfamplus magnetovallimortis]|uniref:hypothetical protein n=1 Tax=Desulfamplus magnetovallimortis TaxID=1246637 RepID=UPI0011183F08|nr:hypothetical protein [Desulfamplus magnetovallimortis]